MTIDSLPSTPLGRVTVLGQRDGDRALWQLSGRTPRVPRGDDAYDGATPGVQGLRTLWMRSVARKVGVRPSGERPFLNPLLLEMFAAAADDERGGAFDLEVDGLRGHATLAGEQKVLVSPAQWHPDFDNAAPLELYVPPYLLEEGVLVLDPDYGSMQKLLPGLVEKSQVEFDRDGVVYLAKVDPPDGSATITTMVRLTRRKGKYKLTLLPSRQATDGVRRWNAVWSALQQLAEATRVTAWSRLRFNVGGELPALSWAPERTGRAITVDWANVALPNGLATVSMADQPTESQALGPEQVLILEPAFTISCKRNENAIILTYGTKETEVDYCFRTDPPEESITIDTMPMVHAPTQVDVALRTAYAPLAPPPPPSPVSGFAKVAHGWLELPFAADGTFPPRLARAEADDAHGSLLIGLRRRQFQPFGAPARQVPWSVRLDEPSSFSARFEFTAGKLRYARITLKNSAMQVRGLLWLANRAPDGDDALPVVSDNPADFLDVVLNRADAAPGAAPFALSGLKLIAPKRAGDDWDGMPPGARAPALDPPAALSIDAALLVAKAGAVQRLWQRHPTLASIQASSDTRADEASPRPHASRAMAQFKRDAGRLAMNSLTAMHASVDPLPGAVFGAAGTDAEPHAPLVALSLPGIELIPVTPSSWLTAGRYRLPVLDETCARAVLPPPENAGAAPPPVVAPPALPPPTVLDPERMEQLRIAHGARRKLADTQSSVMFGPGAVQQALALAPTALAEPRAWTATALVDSAVSIVDGKLRMGSVAFAQEGTGFWSATGDALLRGYDAMLDFSKPGRVRLAADGKVVLRGWSVAERLDGGFVFDGRGVGWSAQVKEGNGLLTRELRIESGAGAEQPRTLLGTAAALELAGVGGTPWRLSLTDLPLAANGEWKAPAAFDARLHGVEQGWTWALFEKGATGLASLALHKVLRFSPAALAYVKVGAAGTLSDVWIEGALTLGMDVTEESDDTRCRVRLIFQPDGAKLALKQIVVPGAPEGRIAWDLAAARDGGGLAGGVAQLSCKLAFGSDVLALKDAKLEATLFGARVAAELGNIDLAASTFKKEFVPPAVPRVLGLASIELDLSRARLVEAGFEGKLRDGVSVRVAERRADGTEPDKPFAYVDWFGNRIEWTQVGLDGARAAVTLGEPARVSAQLFPGLAAGTVLDGVVCLALGAPAAGGQFPVLQHFAEWQFGAFGAVTVTHMMHSLDGLDVLRFDGELQQDSLVRWPDLAPPQIGAADSVDVEFGTVGKVAHRARIRLADHRLDGAWVGQAAGGGLALSGAGLAGGPVNWLVEATHSFEWADGTLDVRCLHPLQLWNAAQLSARVAALQNQFGFTPSYNGRTASASYPSIGVRAVVLAFAGIVDQRLAQPLRDLGDTWCLLGGISSWVPGANGAYQGLHLPFIGALCDAGPTRALRALLDVPQASASSVLRMSRHDVASTAMRIDAAAAWGPGQILRPPQAEAIAPTVAGYPAQALSGTALAQGWFGAAVQKAEPGWHTEQFQRPGDDKNPPPLPHPFPRAAIMLSALRRAGISITLPPLSVLARFDGHDDDYSVKVQTVRVQPAAAPGQAPSAPRDRDAAADLVIGAPERLARVGVADAEAAGAGPKQLLALALREVDEPVFIVRRQPRSRGADPGSGSFTVVPLPRRGPDPLAAAALPLRAEGRFATDGRLTWPEPEAETDKAQLAAFCGPRAPLQSTAQGIGAVAGALAPPRLAGGEFTLEPADGGVGTVWLQEWHRIAFEVSATAPEDAPPREYDGATAVRPLAPSREAVAQALRRMDTGLRGRLQTCLPPRIDDIGQSIRSGALMESGVRVLRTWGEDRHRMDAQAMAGPAATRSMRIPRPCGLPPNAGAPGSWRRTVGWYGDALHSCMTLPGAWDMIAADPEAGGVPPWACLMGNPAPYGVAAAAGGQALVWKGAMRVECMLLSAAAREREGMAGLAPAEFVLSLLQQALPQPDGVRTGLRRAGGYTPYRRVAMLDRDHLVFWPADDAALVPGAAECTFECGLLVKGGWPDASGVSAVELPAPKPRTELDPVAFRTMRLKAVAPAADSYALPLVTRTVLFGDPAYDRRLSEVNPLTYTVQASTADGTDGFTFWADRTTVVPGEEIVLHAFGAASYTLTAKVIRKGAQQAERPLRFVLDGSSTAGADSVGFGLRTDYVGLPTSMLADGSGEALSVGDLLVLELRADTSRLGPARLFIGVKDVSALPAPAALYSLLAVEEATPRSWCALHSAAPRAESIHTFVSKVKTGDRTDEVVIRRASFRWSYTEAAGADPSAFSILKTDLDTESTHVPDSLERQLDSAAVRIEALGGPVNPGLAGIDVWSGSGAVDWGKVKKAGIAFAYVRAAYGDVADRRAKEYLEGARAAKVKAGVYHFLRATKDYQAQIDLMIGLLDRLGIGRGDLPPALDIEDNPAYDGPWDPAGNDRFCTAVAMWVDAVKKKTGAMPVIYTRRDFWDALGNPAGFEKCPLWIASYRDAPPRIPQGWADYTFWQYSEKGKIDGIGVAVDLNRFFSNDPAALDKLLLK